MAAEIEAEFEPNKGRNQIEVEVALDAKRSRIESVAAYDYHSSLRFHSGADFHLHLCSRISSLFRTIFAAYVTQCRMLNSSGQWTEIIFFFFLEIQFIWMCSSFVFWANVPN